LRRWVGWWLLLSLLSAGCSTPTPTPEPVTISFAFPSSDVVYYSELIARFQEQYPHIHVERKPQRSEEDYVQPLQAGRVDTAALFYGFSDSLGELVEQGEILNLTPFIEDDESFALDDYWPAVLAAGKAHGEFWAIPAGVDLQVMYYNRSLYDRAGLPYPDLEWMWDDLEEAALSIRDPEEQVYGCAVEPSLMAFLLTYQRGGRLLNDWENPTYSTFDDPLAIDALRWLVDLADREGAILTDAQSREVFGGGTWRAVQRSQVGLWTGAFSERGGGDGALGWAVNWGMAPMPRDAEAATMGVVNVFVISAQARHPEACWEWLKFLDAQGPLHQMSPRRSVMASEAYEQRVGKEAAAVARASIENALILSAVHLASGKMWMAYTDAVENALSGKLTPEEAMQRAQRQSPVR
jgi:multiple sugar transport system substrate-binding protein